MLINNEAGFIMAMLESGEMYLETIYILSRNSSSVRGIDIGEYMGFTKPSVSRAIGLLKKKGLVFTDDLGYIRLSEEGEKKAKSIYERHVVLTKLFINMFKMELMICLAIILL